MIGYATSQMSQLSEDELDRVTAAIISLHECVKIMDRHEAPQNVKGTFVGMIGDLQQSMLSADENHNERVARISRILSEVFPGVYSN
jgi:hypothetical protein